MTTNKPSVFRKTVSLLIGICVLYFVVGGVLVLVSVLNATTYGVLGGVVGGLASVLGLVSLARPTINKQDLQQIELESLKELAETSQKIKELEEARAARRQEILTLEEQKQQMEFLVRKASLSLFLQEQRSLYEKRVLDVVYSNKELASCLTELQTIDTKIKALNDEIESDPNVDLLKTIITSAKKRTEDIELDFSDYPLFARTMMIAFRELGQFVSKVLKTV